MKSVIANNASEELAHDSELETGSLPVTDAELEKQYLRPGYKFKDIELWPYTHGMELLCNQVRDPQDTGLYTWLAFVFLHIKRGGATAAIDRKLNVLPLAWDVELFREKLIEWIDEIGLTEADKHEAGKLYEEMRAEADRAKVEVAPGRGKKKEAARSPRRRRS